MDQQSDALVQIVGPTDNWILHELAQRLARKLPYAEFVPWQPRAGGRARLAYYVNYALYHGPSGLIDVSFFTHYEEAHQFLERARRLDSCVSMSKLYADWLRGQGVGHVVHIPMGFDSYRYRPRLVLGVFSRLEQPRKGKRLVERLRQLPFVELVLTEGEAKAEALPGLYQRVDYVLIPATVEGGPMSLLEGLGMGKPVIAPANVGMVPELPAGAHIRTYPAGDAEALARVVSTCYEEKLARARLVQERTWDRWAEGHHELFRDLLRARGVAAPEQAPGFRFGMLAELEVPFGICVERLETGVDGVATQLFYGRYREARRALEELAGEFPFVEKLRGSIRAGLCAI